jgi:hypothetical protein
MRLDSRALQTLAWYVGWQLQRRPSCEAQAFLCLTSIPVSCAMKRTYSRRRTFHATVARQSSDPSSDQMRSRVRGRRKNEERKKFLQIGHFWSGIEKCPRQESNLRTRFRKPLLYPLS